MSKKTNFLHKIIKNRSAFFGILLLLIIYIVALFLPLLIHLKPLQLNIVERLSEPSKNALFGTDSFGRDIFSRVIFGIRTSGLVGFSVMIISSAGGIIIGLISGFYKKIGNLLMRSMDGLMAFPSILLAIGIMAILGSKAFNIVIALSLVYIPRTARIVYSSTIKVEQKEYITAMKALGASNLRIILKHILPNILSPIIVQSTFIFAYAILAEAALSFVGVGVPAPQPTLGNILSEGRNYMTTAPWITIFPGILISLIVLSINLIGDGFRDLLDVKLR